MEIVRSPILYYVTMVTNPMSNPPYSGPTLPLCMPPTFFILRGYLKNTKNIKSLNETIRAVPEMIHLCQDGTPTGTVVLRWYPNWYIWYMSKVRLPVGVTVYIYFVLFRSFNK